MSDTLTLDAYVLATLMPDLVGHDRRPSALLAYLAVLAEGRGARVALSHAQLAERTGLSKRAVQDAVHHLQRRGLLEVTRRAATEPPAYMPLSPWRSAT